MEGKILVKGNEALICFPDKTLFGMFVAPTVIDVHCQGQFEDFVPFVPDEILSCEVEETSSGMIVIKEQV